MPTPSSRASGTPPSVAMKSPVRLVVAFGVAALIALFGGAIRVDAQTTQSCGNEGEAPCALIDLPTVGRCDTALTPVTRVCGCVLRGPFGNCLIPRLCTTCVNERRRVPAVNGFLGSWTDWALRNQRDLAVDEPLNWVTQLGTHNSFNSLADGHSAFVLPNQVYSITDQLRTGARVLTLDLHYLEGNARLCHAIDSNGFGIAPCFVPNPAVTGLFLPGLRFYANGVKEIRNWLNSNPGEIVVINTEEYVDTSHLLDPLETYLGSRLLRSPLTSPEGFDTTRWPTRREMLVDGKTVIVHTKTGQPPTSFQESTIVGSFGGDPNPWFANNLRRYPSCPASNAFTAAADTDRFTATVFPPLSAGDVVQFQGGALPGGISAGTAYYVLAAGASFRVSTVRGGAPVELTTDGGGRLFSSGFKTASLTVEDREWGTVAGSIGWEGADVGHLDPNDVADAAACNYGLIVLDQFSRSGFLGPLDYSRQEAAVWSWNAGDRGQHGACAMFSGTTGRWASADCTLPRQFACAKPRSESGLDPLEWTDPAGLDWRITAAAGPWDQGHEVCASEFPGYVAGVPVNGFQNRVLRDTNTTNASVWLNYSRRDSTRWTIRPRPATTAPPVADAGPDQTIECAATFTLDGSASTDPNGDPLTYTWTGPFGTLTGATVETTLGPGTHAIVLTVDDGHGGRDTDSVQITIQDTTPPTLSVQLSPDRLWPPTKQLIDIVATIESTDACDAEPPSIELLSITSHQEGDIKPPGRVRTSIAGAEIGTDDREFQLLSALEGIGTRTYTATYKATDLAGVETTASGQVVVAKPPLKTDVEKKR